VRDESWKLPCEYSGRLWRLASSPLRKYYAVSISCTSMSMKPASSLEHLRREELVVQPATADLEDFGGRYCIFREPSKAGLRKRLREKTQRMKRAQLVGRHNGFCQEER
jgi:hypothetical protein